MLTPRGHRDWSSISYKPLIAAHYPALLIDALTESASVLEIGCNEGIVCHYIASNRPDVVVRGIDINEEAIALARKEVADSRLSNVEFETCDVLHDSGSYDAVVAIRVLTCFPHEEEWRALVESVERLLRIGGLFYAVDYIFDPANPAYTERYARGEHDGCRRGTFHVNTPSGELLFLAHHHTEEEIVCMTRRFVPLSFRRFESLSMNGNPVMLFELLGRRTEAH